VIRIQRGVRVWVRAVGFSLLGVPLTAMSCVAILGYGLAPGGRLCVLVADLEARRVAWAAGVRIGRPAPPRRALRCLLVVPPLTVVELASIALLVWGLAALGAAVPFWASGALPEAIGATAAGVIAASAAPWLTTGVVQFHARLARRLPEPSPLEERVEALTESRARGMDAAALERRRIERDLHDGAQQRLVALALGLGMARGKLEGDPAAARELVAEAHEEAKRALAEIRDLARGIHPAVLTDRGLDAAISALAGRCPVPVEIDVPLRARLPEAVESTAYFFVSEALTNVARHSGASSASVRARIDAGRLLVEVEDDGVGGASRRPGSGLSGLADRLAAFDGSLALRSPTGGPTVVSMAIPCE
jgi:signal transduction histidine kinase